MQTKLDQVNACQKKQVYDQFQSRDFESISAITQRSSTIASQTNETEWGFFSIHALNFGPTQPRQNTGHYEQVSSETEPKMMHLEFHGQGSLASITKARHQKETWLPENYSATCYNMRGEIKRELPTLKRDIKLKQNKFQRKKYRNYLDNEVKPKQTIE